MRVILAGQRSFGAAVFDMLREEGHDIAAVWSPARNDDALTRKVSRADRPDHPDLGLYAFPSPSLDRTPEQVRKLEVDLFVAAHSHDFIGCDSRAATRLGGVGYHPSLLPRHRGRDAVRWAVHMGDPVAGGSVYWLTDAVDGGPIAAQDWCFIPRLGAGVEEEIASWLWRERLFPMGVELLRETLRDLNHGIIIEREQDEAYATWEPSWERPPLHRPELPQIGARVGMEHRLGRKR